MKAIIIVLNMKEKSALEGHRSFLTVKREICSPPEFKSTSKRCLVTFSRCELSGFGHKIFLLIQEKRKAAFLTDNIFQMGNLIDSKEASHIKISRHT